MHKYTYLQKKEVKTNHYFFSNVVLIFIYVSTRVYSIVIIVYNTNKHMQG